MRRPFDAIAKRSLRLFRGPAPQGRDTYAALATFPSETLREAHAAEDLTPYEKRVFSQNGEDGILIELLRRIGTSTKWFIEFGAGRGTEANCVLLADVLGWSGLFLEGDPLAAAALTAKYEYNVRVMGHHAYVLSSNVESLFQNAGVPKEPDVLSIDIDGNDWWVWRAIEDYRPRIVVIEYNGLLPPGRRLVMPESNRRYEHNVHFGASLDAFEALGKDKGYVLVHTELAGVNAFFIRSDLAGALSGLRVPRRAGNYYLGGAPAMGCWTEFEWLDLDEHPDLIFRR